MTVTTEYLHPLYRSIFTYIYFNENPTASYSDWDKQWAKCDNCTFQLSVNVTFPKSMRQKEISWDIIKLQVKNMMSL